MLISRLFFRHLIVFQRFSFLGGGEHKKASNKPIIDLLDSQFEAILKNHALLQQIE